jgi:hypothetical protein
MLARGSDPSGVSNFPSLGLGGTDAEPGNLIFQYTFDADKADGPLTQVRKTTSWPRSWANFSLF